MDEVEGVGIANIENWVLIYTGNGLSFNKNSGLTATYHYRFKVLAINEQLLESLYSNIAEYIAASLPS